MRCLSLRHVAAVCLTVLAALPALSLEAGELCCALCGCHDRTTKVCRLVCETKKVPITCYGCREEDFCVPGPSTPGAEHCEAVCGSSLPCAQRRFVWSEWFPAGSADVFTRKKLQKRTVTREVPSYKWVTEDLCPRCAADCETGENP